MPSSEAYEVDLPRVSGGKATLNLSVTVDAAEVEVGAHGFSVDVLSRPRVFAGPPVDGRSHGYTAIAENQLVDFLSTEPKVVRHVEMTRKNVLERR